MSNAWNEQQRRWRRFEAWENDRLRDKPSDYTSALAWMAEAWELALRLAPSFQNDEGAERHWRHLTAVQRALAQALPSR